MSVLFVLPIRGGKAEKFIGNRLKYEAIQIKTNYLPGIDVSDLRDLINLDSIVFGNRTKKACSAVSLPLNTETMVSLIRELPAFQPRSFRHPYPI